MLAEIACFVNRLVSRYCSNTQQIQGKSPPLKNVKDGAPQNSKSEAGPPALVAQPVQPPINHINPMAGGNGMSSL